MFQLVCDPSGAVVDTSLQQLVPAVIKWGNKLEHILRVLLSHILSSVQVYMLLTNIFLIYDYKIYVFCHQLFSYENAALPTSIRG